MWNHPVVAIAFNYCFAKDTTTEFPRIVKI